MSASGQSDHPQRPREPAGRRADGRPKRNGPGQTSYDGYRNGAPVATIGALSDTDNINHKGSASYAYNSAAGVSSRSKRATVRF
jgi:hypothetical protein